MANMPMLNNYYEIGKIVWTYSTGLDFDTQTAPVDTPSEEDLQKELVDAGLNLPANVNIKIVRDDPNTFHVVLRDKETMRANLADLRSAKGEYDFHSELRDAYVAFLTDPDDYVGDTADAKENRVRMVSHRLADYTFTLCAS